MDLVAEKLEALVLQAEISLDALLLELEENLPCQAELQLKPSAIISSIQAMQSELQELKQESDSLIQNQEEVRNQLEKELEVACRKIQNLKNKTGCKSIYSNAAGSALKTHFEKLNI